MKKILYIFISFLFALSIIKHSYATENKILLKVNNEIITSIDLLNENLYLASINEDFEKLDKFQRFEISKKSLIREKIKKIELLTVVNEIKIEEELLNNLSISYFKRLGIKSILDFNNYFLNKGVDPNIVRSKITFEILWNQLIYAKFNKNVKINKETIKTELLKNNQQKEFMISELLFNLVSNEKLDDKLNLIKQEINETNFSQAALKYSISDTSRNGGKLGWIKESSLNTKMINELNKIKIGEVTKPIQIPGGFLILKIENIRNVERKFNLENEIEEIVKQKTNEQLNQYSNIYFNKIKKNIQIDEL